jgi:DNA-binding NarL/FixJ family response regulator
LLFDQIDCVSTPEDIEEVLSNPELIHQYDLACLDLQIPPYPERGIYDGIDFGRALLGLNPDLKSIIITNETSHSMLLKAYKDLNPYSIIIKAEMTLETLEKAITMALEGENYWSNTFSEIIKSVLNDKNAFTQEDYKLLELLSEGVPTKDIPEHLPWSVSKIEKRKKKLRDELNIESKSVLKLVAMARKKGLIS